MLTIKRLDMRIGQSCIPLFFFAKNEWSPDFADRLRLQGEEGADEAEESTEATKEEEKSS